MSEKMLTPRELAERIKIEMKTLANWRCSRGKGPRFRRYGNRILYPESAVIEWEQDREFSSTLDYEDAGTQAAKALRDRVAQLKAELIAAEQALDESSRQQG